MSTATSFGGGGRKAERGGGRPSRNMKSPSQRARPGACRDVHRRPACQGTRRSARTRRLPGLTRRLTSEVQIPNGGFDTTLNARRGRRRSDAPTDDRHIVSVELMPQVRGSPRVQLERHNPRPAVTSAGDRSGSGTDVEDKVTWDDVGVGDESFGPATIELMPPPPWRGVADTADHHHEAVMVRR